MLVFSFIMDFTADMFPSFAAEMSCSSFSLFDFSIEHLFFKF